MLRHCSTNPSGERPGNEHAPRPRFGRPRLTRDRSSARDTPTARIGGAEPTIRSGAAQESNLPTAGLRRLTGFEDRLGHQPRAAPRGGYASRAKARARNPPSARVGQLPACSRSSTSPTSPAPGGRRGHRRGRRALLRLRELLRARRAAGSRVAAGDERAQGPAAATRSGSVTTTPERAQPGLRLGPRAAAVERARGRDGRPARARPDRLPRAGGRAHPGPPDRHRRRRAHGAADLARRRLPGNALVGDVLDLIGEEILYITSANTSSHVSKQMEAAHFEIREIRRSSATATTSC